MSTLDVVPAENLVTSSVTSIPTSAAIPNIRKPELDEPVTRGQIVIDQRAENKYGRPTHALHALPKGIKFRSIVADQILCSILIVLALVYTINRLLTWVGNGFGIPHFTLDLIFGYMFYPITFLLGLLGILSNELLHIARLLVTKLVANGFVACLALKYQHKAIPFSSRGCSILPGDNVLNEDLQRRSTT